MAGYFGRLSFFIFFVFSLSRLPLTLGAAPQFIEPPPNITVVKTENATINWSYIVDDKSLFDDNSPVWEYKEPGKEWKKIAYEDKNDGPWKWKISSDCPAKFKNPLRVGKGESNASLVIQNTTLNDSGLYRCKLQIIASSSVISNEVQLNVKVPISTIPTTVSTTPAMTKNITTPSPTTPITVDDCTTGVIVGCVIGLIIAVVIIVVIGVVIYKKKKAKKEWTTLEKGIIGFGLFVAVVVIIVIIVLFLLNCL